MLNSRKRLIKINDIKESKKSNIIFHSIDSYTTIQLDDSDNNYQELHDYIELINQGSSLTLQLKFTEALTIYQKALSIAEKLRDEYKKNESKCNIGIINFYLGNLNEAIIFIQNCYNHFNSICTFEKGMNNIKNLSFLCKSGANLCMCQLTMNSQYNNCISIIKNIIDIISKEENLYKILFCVKYLNNILFRVNSLVVNKNNYFNKFDMFENNYEEIKNNFILNENEYNSINQLFIESFDYFIETYKIEPWIKSLNIIYQKMQKLNDNQGLIYILLNQILATCLKYSNENENINNNFDNYYDNNDNVEINEAKQKLEKLLIGVAEDNSIYNNEINMNNNSIINSNNKINFIINEDDINNIIEDYKSKIFVIRKIYQIIYSFEEQLDGKFEENKKFEKINSNIFGLNNIIENKNIFKSNNFNSYNIRYIKLNINSEFYLKLLLNYSIFYFQENIKDMNLKYNLISDTNMALKLINSKKIDISKFDMSEFDPEISESLSLLLNDFFKIYRKNKLNQIFNKFKVQKIMKKKKEIKINVEPKLKLFFEKQYLYIFKGENIQKINYHSTGIKEHFYQIDYENDLFESFSKNPNKLRPKKTYKFDDIKKIVIGFKTKNVKNKLKNLKSLKDIKKKPYCFISLVLTKRTIDLVFMKENSVKNWFYGFFHYFQMSDRKYKIVSCTNNILFRIKCKMINKINGNIKKLNKQSFCSCLLNYFNFQNEGNSENEEKEDSEKEIEENDEKIDEN